MFPVCSQFVPSLFPINAFEFTAFLVFRVFRFRYIGRVR
jgi:hypothetical protein